MNTEKCCAPATSPRKSLPRAMRGGNKLSATAPLAPFMALDTECSTCSERGWWCAESAWSQWVSGGARPDGATLYMGRAARAARALFTLSGRVGGYRIQITPCGVVYAEGTEAPIGRLPQKKAR